METRKSTTAGVLFWTPAPIRISPTSSGISDECVWEDEDEEQAEKDQGFLSQMDENGIIGLSEELGNMEFEENGSDADSEDDPYPYSRPFTPEEADPSGHGRDTPPEETSYYTESTKGDAAQMLPPCVDLRDSFKAQTVEEEVSQKREGLPEGDSYSDMTEDEEDGEEAEKTSDRENFSESHISKIEIKKISSTQSGSAHLLAVEPAAGVSSHHDSISQHASVTAPTFLHRRYFSTEEIVAAPDIEAESFPEMSGTESLSESHISLKSILPFPEVKPRTFHQPAAVTASDEFISDHDCGVSNMPLMGSVKSNKLQEKPTPSPRKSRQHSPGASSSRIPSPSKVRTRSPPNREPRTPRASSYAPEVDDSRKGPLTYRTPDFSKVEPRVRFPKGGYSPPKSKSSSRAMSLSPQPPLVFKSPAEIVKEILLNTNEGYSGLSYPYNPHSSDPKSTVPQEFRCRLQATTLLEQLQDDYNRLLTKYAEAENTIDRLRLEGKVTLYSDPPNPGHSMQSVRNNEASKIMTLDFPQAQKAEISSASLHPNGHSTPPQRSPSATSFKRLPAPQQLAKILSNQALKFFQQLHTFEDLLKNKRLKPFEQMKGVTQLAQGLDSLERGYLLAREEHKYLQQQSDQISNFDPERELEGLIFNCGQRMDELKDQVVQMRQEKPTCEAPPSPPPQPTPPTPPSVGGQTPTNPQSPPDPLLVDLVESAPVELSSASEESGEEEVETEYEETLKPQKHKPLNNKHSLVEQDVATDYSQSFTELPKHFHHSQRQAAPLSPALGTDMQPGEQEKEKQGQGSGSLEVQRSPQRESDHQDSSKQRSSRSSPSSPRTSSQSGPHPVHPPSSSRSSSRRIEAGKSPSSSLSSLAEITGSERNKLQTGSSMLLSQDGIISPGTDSGFVGSESSHLTPAAAPSPLHQRAAESVSEPPQGNPGTPQTGPVSAASPAFSSPTHSSHTAAESRGSSHLSSDPPRRSRQGQSRGSFFCSPQMQHTRADSGTSDYGLLSDCTPAMSSARYRESINSPHSRSQSSSPTAPHRHSDSPREPSYLQAAIRNNALRSLQTEVTRLRETLDFCLKNKKAPSTQDKYTHQNTATPLVRSGERWSYVIREGRRERQTADDCEESTVRRTTRKKPQPQPEVSAGSQPSTSQPQQSRCTQTASVRSRTHRQHPGVHVSETAAEADSRSRQVPLCLTRNRGQPERPVGGNREPPHSSRCRHCPLCGNSELPAVYRDAPTHTSCLPAPGPDTALRRGYFATAAPPVPLQCTPVCPPPLLLCTSPLYVSPSNRTGPSSMDRGGGRKRRSLSLGRQSSMDSSLNKAIRAARHMKHTSGHMAHSLATGLHYQELLTQSCSH